jgi:hypothetical protein
MMKMRFTLSYPFILLLCNSREWYELGIVKEVEDVVAISLKVLPRCPLVGIISQPGFILGTYRMAVWQEMRKQLLLSRKIRCVALCLLRVVRQRGRFHLFSKIRYTYSRTPWIQLKWRNFLHRSGWGHELLTVAKTLQCKRNLSFTRMLCSFSAATSLDRKWETAGVRRFVVSSLLCLFFYVKPTYCGRCCRRFGSTRCFHLRGCRPPNVGIVAHSHEV